MGPAQAPTAPGRLGQSIPAAELLPFLAELENWLADRRQQLDRLDETAQQLSSDSAHTADLMLALTMWQTIRTRTDELLTVWDSGRADDVAREEMSRLIWGRLESSLLSLAEAISVGDALIAQLRRSLAFDPNTAAQTDRLRALRAALARCEDLAMDDHADDAGRIEALGAREAQLSANAARDHDITGPLTELETKVAVAERDLIVAAAQQRMFVKERRDTSALLATLEAREPTLHQLADRCRREIVRPPNLAVPEVVRLGPVPQVRAEFEAYQTRLDMVRRAFDAVADAYSGPLRERAQLRYRLEGLRATADANGRSTSATVQAGFTEARAAVDATPCDVDQSRFLVEQYQFLTKGAPL